MKSTNKRALLLIAATTSIALVMAPSSAYAKSCAKPGYSIAETTAGTVLMRKPFRNTKRSDSRSGTFYVCSRRFGNRIGIGRFGWDSEGWGYFSRMVKNERFVAFSTGWTNGVSWTSDEHVQVFDLKTRSRRRLRVQPSEFGTWVSTIALDGRGAIGWIEVGDDTGGTFTSVWHSPNDGDTNKYLLASDPQIDPSFLRFGIREGKKQLIWTTSVSGADY